jgi:hypothetical protein
LLFFGSYEEELTQYWSQMSNAMGLSSNMFESESPDDTRDDVGMVGICALQVAIGLDWNCSRFDCFEFRIETMGGEKCCCVGFIKILVRSKI